LEGKGKKAISEEINEEKKKKKEKKEEENKDNTRTFCHKDDEVST